MSEFVNVALHNTEILLETIVAVSIILFEFVGVAVLLIAGTKGFYGYITRNPLTRLNLAKGMAMALEFKLGGEILRTVTVRDTKELIIVGGLVMLRGALAFLIHWEIKTEEKDNEVDTEEQK